MKGEYPFTIHERSVSEIFKTNLILLNKFLVLFNPDLSHSFALEKQSRSCPLTATSHYKKAALTTLNKFYRTGRRMLHKTGNTK